MFYILWYRAINHDNDTDEIYGIFESKDKANQALEFYKEHYPPLYRSMRIEEREFDEVPQWD